MSYRVLALDTLRSICNEHCHMALFDFVAEHNRDSLVAQATSDLKTALEFLLKNPGDASTLPWCLEATRITQATLLQQTARDEVAEYYLRRHFAADCHGLSPEYLRYACRHHASVLASPDA